jgi:hypothetical protein
LIYVLSIFITKAKIPHRFIVYTDKKIADFPLDKRKTLRGFLE